MKPERTDDLKVLFIGNSYTAGTQKTFEKLAAANSYTNSTFTFIWGGGATLQKLTDNGRALKWIRKHEWDYVVLQEQSVRPALSEASERSFHKSVDELAGHIRESGAQPVLYMTWGRRDGLVMDGDLVFDYGTMQKKLADAYIQAGKRNDIRVAPVGEAWGMVRKKDPELGRALYQGDGSHPSSKGAFLASCVFFRVLFDAPLNELILPEDMDKDEFRFMRDVVDEMPL